jgi:hypothetical protein
LIKNGLRVEWLSQKKALYVSWKPTDVNQDQYKKQFSTTYYNTESNQFQMANPPQVAQNPVHQVHQLVNVRQAPISESTTKSKTKSKKSNEKPIMQHVAMIKYGENIKDIIHFLWMGE